MTIVDTSVWIDFLRLKPEAQSLMTPLIEDDQIVVLSPVFGELLQGARDIREEKIIIELWENFAKIGRIYIIRGCWYPILQA